MARTNNIALVFDFDLTLTPHYSERPIFREYDYNEEKFWQECDNEYKKRIEKLNKRKQVGIFGPKETLCYETIYAGLLVDYVQKGIFSNLTLDKLYELGKKIEFHPGVPKFMQRHKEFVKENPKWRKHNIDLEFYVISCAIEEMIKGSKIAPYLSGLFATKFSENEKGISKVLHAISYTEKTKFLYKINKGPEFDENDYVPHESRRVDKMSINYFGDGGSDVPCFAAVAEMGGKAFGLYRNNEESFKEASDLQREKRIFAIGPTDYNENSHTDRYIKLMISEEADRKVFETEEKIAKVIGIHPKP